MKKIHTTDKGEQTTGSGINKLFRFTFSFAIFMLATLYSSAQQCGCTIHTIEVDTNDYVLNPGVVLCVDSGSVCTGKISLAGGELCVRGIANPSSVAFIPTSIGGSSGAIAISGHGTLSTESDFSLGKISMLISSKGTVNISGDLILAVTGSSIYNQGSLNVKKKLQINSGCSITNIGNINYQSLQNNGTVSGNGNIISTVTTQQQ